MSVTRINEFLAQEGQGETLRKLIQSFQADIEASQGCHSCKVLQSKQNADSVVVIEIWDSVEDHEASVKNIPVEALQAAMKLLAAPPKGEYFQ